ncbi:hypothetical protein Lepto7375DRAFT_0600, partial [Leptolyngbya sp. PCC 7375]
IGLTSKSLTSALYSDGTAHARGTRLISVVVLPSIGENSVDARCLTIEADP